MCTATLKRVSDSRDRDQESEREVGLGLDRGSLKHTRGSIKTFNKNKVYNCGQMPLVVGHVVSCEAVAGKATLKLCRVDIGQGDPIPVVTNASNVRTDTHTVVAIVGTEIEVDGETITITRTNVGGLYSEGMLCDSTMCGWVGGAKGICVQVPLDLPPGSPAPATKPRLGGGGGAEEKAAEPELSAKELKAKEKAERKAANAAKKEARKAAKGGRTDEGDGEGEGEGEPAEEEEG